MDQQGEQSAIHEWKYSDKRILTPKEFLLEVKDKLSKKKVLSIGEHHDMEQDESYSWIQQYSGEILEAYQFYKIGKNSHKFSPSFVELLRPTSELRKRLTQMQRPSFDELRKMHVGRLFAFGVLPIAKALDYTNIVLEGFDENDPLRTIQRSKDKTGDLLRITSAMMLDMNIYGALSDGIFSTPTDIGNSLFETIREVKDTDPDAKIVVYNGALHSMTEPFKSGTTVKEGLLQISDASQWTYAPRAKELWGDQYGAIDLLNGDRLLPPSHFRYMQEQADADSITCFSHGVDQQTYVLK